MKNNMTKQERQAIIDEINSLEGEEKQAAIDAFKKIAEARKSGTGVLPQELEIEEDPDLIDPESNDTIVDGEDADIEDPDNVLRDKKTMSDSVPTDDDEEEDEDDDEEGPSGSGSSSEDEDNSDNGDSDGDDSEEDEDSDDMEDDSNDGENSDDEEDDTSNGNGSQDDDDDDSEGASQDDEEESEEGDGEYDADDVDDEDNVRNPEDEEPEDEEAEDEEESDSEEFTDEEEQAIKDMDDMLRNMFGKDFEKDPEEDPEDDEEGSGGGSDDEDDSEDDEESDDSRNNSTAENDADENEEESEEGDDDAESSDFGNDDDTELPDDDMDNAPDFDERDDSSGNENTPVQDKGEERESNYDDVDFQTPGIDNPDEPTQSDDESDGEADEDESDDEPDEDDEDEYDFSQETGINADDFEDKEKKEKTANEFFRRKLTISRIKSALDRAKEIADSVKEESLELTEADANSYKKLAEAERILQELIDQYEKDLAAGELSDADEFDDRVNAILDIIENETGDAAMSRTQDKDDRVKEIEKDEEQSAYSEINAEDNANRKLDPQSPENKKKADRKKMKAKPGGGIFGRARPASTMRQLKIDLEEALKEQVEVAEREYFTDNSYAYLDRHHPDLMSPGEYEDVRLIPSKLMPTVDVYIDQSGSWGDDEVKKVLDALKSIEDLVYDEKTNPEGKVILNVYYFGYQVLSPDIEVARARCWGESWDLCIDNILSEPETKNVIFVTDQNILYDYGVYGAHGCIEGKHARVEGFVWWIWKDVYNTVPQATEALVGELGCKEYVLS